MVKIIRPMKGVMTSTGPNHIPTLQEVRHMADQDSKIPYGFCQCGCGQKTRISPETSKRHGYIKGEPIRFIRYHHMRIRYIWPERFWDKVNITEGCWLWTADHNGRYGIAILPGRKRIFAHRASWELANGPIPKDMFVCHKCDNPLCVRPDHLFLGTPYDNVQDMIHKGRTNWPKGEVQGNSKLTEIQVRAILKDPRPYVLIAKDYKIGPDSISRIKNGKRWKHIER